MKNHKSVLLAVLGMILILGISSCNKDEGPTENRIDIYATPEFQIAEPDNSPAEIIEGDLENQFALVEQNEDYRFCDNQQMMNGKKFQERRRFMPLARILHVLQLDEEQREMVKDFMFDYRLCIRESIIKLRETEKELLDPINEQRRAILEAYKNGEITREEAQIKLRELAIQARELLKENPARQIACEEMKECRRLLLENIRSILNDDQIEKWDEWVSRLPEINCDRDE
jgi:hypothetical protein